MAAEYILKEGNPNVMLCERGIRTFETAYRFTLDLMAVPVLKELSHLPVIVDPSHAAGRRDLVDAAVAGRGRGRRRRHHRRGAPEPRRGDLRRAAGSCARRTSPHYARAVERPPRWRARRLTGQGAGPCLSHPDAQLRPADYVRDRRIERVVPLLAPDALLEELPLGREQADVVIRGRRDVARGPGRRRCSGCSPSSGRAACTIPMRRSSTRRCSAQLARDLSGELLIAMRVYFEKPRTTTGWKGLINDPHLDGSGDVNAGLHLARRVLLGVLDAGLPVGCEFLDPITPQYIADAVSWGAIGARTTESQIHRQLGSGLSMPVGFKNRTDGNVQVAVDAVRAAAEPHAFAGIDPNGTPAILYTRGNSDCHIILRGGKGRPNYDAASVAAALELLDGAGPAERA